MVGRTIKNIIYIVISCVFSFLLFGCVFTLKINEEKHLYLSEETVEIKLTAKNIRGIHYFIEIKSKKGNIEVHPGKLKLMSIPMKNKLETPKFDYKKESMKGTFQVKQGETFVCQFSAYPDFQKGIPINEIHILPRDFITHNGNPLITDTIRIKVQ